MVVIAQYQVNRQPCLAEWFEFLDEHCVIAGLAVHVSQIADNHHPCRLVRQPQDRLANHCEVGRRFYAAVFLVALGPKVRIGQENPAAPLGLLGAEGCAPKCQTCAGSQRAGQKLPPRDGRQCNRHGTLAFVVSVK